MASQKQITANQANRKRWRGISPEGLQRLREAALRNRPWERSTGPRTQAGRVAVRMNALKSGLRSGVINDGLRALHRMCMSVYQPEDGSTNFEELNAAIADCIAVMDLRISRSQTPAGENADRADPPPAVRLGDG